MTIPRRVLDNASRIPEHPAFMVRGSGGWEPVSWSRYGDRVRRVGAALHSVGVRSGDAVAVLGVNRPEWVEFDVGAMAVGATPAGIYATNSPEEVGYILDDSRAKVVLVENAAQWAKVDGVRAGLTHLERIVLMEGAEPIDDPATATWEEFLELGDPSGSVDRAVAALGPDQAATLIYTSGTTGHPKGVVLTHDNLAWTANQAVDLFGIAAVDRTLSYLPLSHIAEQLFTIHAHATAGYTVWFGRSITRLRSDLAAAKPTVFFGVPRVWEGMARSIHTGLSEARGLRRTLAEWATGAVREFHRDRQAGGASLALRLRYGLARALVTDRIKEGIGFGDTRLAISGAAAISAAVLEDLAAIDLVVREVYGQSESTGPTTINTFESTRFGTVGRAWPGSAVKVADDGEVLVKGRNVFAGYLRDHDATGTTLRDGWLYSGDLGVFDGDGHLTITGRKKEIIVTSGGKNISPKAVEDVLRREDAIDEAVVFGDGRDYLTALVVPSNEIGDDDRRLAVDAAIDAANRHLAKVEWVRRFAVLPGPLTIEAGELTPTLKVRRVVVADRYRELIEGMYPPD